MRVSAARHLCRAVCASAAILLGCTDTPAEEPEFETNVPLHPTTREPAVISVHLHPGMSDGPEEELPLVAALWSDGSIAWSADRVGGGKPYSFSRVSAQSLNELLATLHSRIDELPDDGRSYWVFDAWHQKLHVLDLGRLSGLASCIDLFEENPNLVATEYGIASLEGRDRTGVLAEQSPEHRRFRAVWKECLDAVLHSIPETQESVVQESFEYVHWGSRTGRGNLIPR